MEQHLGRPLRTGETVPHRDGHRSRSLTARALTEVYSSPSLPRVEELSPGLRCRCGRGRGRRERSRPSGNASAVRTMIKVVSHRPLPKGDDESDPPGSSYPHIAA
jgi:hypothetical protein